MSTTAGKVQVAGQLLPVDGPTPGPGSLVTVLVRPEALIVTPDEQADCRRDRRDVPWCHAFGSVSATQTRPSCWRTSRLTAPPTLGLGARVADQAAGPAGPSGMTTLQRTIGGGPPGAGGYRALVPDAGEPHRHRCDLADPPERPGEALLTVAHLSDLHLCDAQSPARVELLDRWADPDSPDP